MIDSPQNNQPAGFKEIQNNQPAGFKETRKTGLCNIKQVDAFLIPPGRYASTLQVISRHFVTLRAEVPVILVEKGPLLAG